MATAPRAEIGRPGRARAGGGEHPVLPLVPVACARIDAIRGELVDDEQRRESRELRDSVVERIDVMKHAPGDDCVERFVVDVLEARAEEARRVGRVRVDTEHVVARGRERRDEAALLAATDLEHACRRRRQLLQHERREVTHDRQRRRSSRRADRVPLRRALQNPGV